MLATNKTMKIITISIISNPMGEIFFVRIMKATKISLNGRLPVSPMGKHRLKICFVSVFPNCSKSEYVAGILVKTMELMEKEKQ